METKEIKLIDMLADAHNLYATLPQYHPDDLHEWIHHIHALQNIVMSRATVRKHPDLFVKTK